MSRSGYSDDCDGWQLIMWRGAVASAIRGKKGQAFLREMAAALDALPGRALIANSFQAGAGVCALGSVCASRGIEAPKLPDNEYWDDYDHGAREFAKRALGIPNALAAEVMFLNDDGWYEETPEQRWTRMRAWVAKQIKEQAP
jgi:hypothetical protein